MVFQTFALFPWLTVLENVQLGLEALGLPEAQIRQRALAGIDLIGLDGYEFGLSARVVGRHAPAGGICPRARRAPQHIADGRAVLRARCVDRGNLAHRLSRSLDRGQAADQGGDPGDPQHRGSGADVRPHSRVLPQPGPHHRGNQGRPAAAAQPAGARVPRSGRAHLCRADRARRPRRRRASRRIASRAWASIWLCRGRPPICSRA